MRQTGTVPADPVLPVSLSIEPGPDLTAEQLQRYARHLNLSGIGSTGQRRLLAARVLVVGAGGLGSPVLLYLAAAGVGTIGIVDPDLVDESNLQRQVIHGTSDVGRAKADSAAESIAAINPDVTVVRHRELLDPGNALPICRDYDLVVDGTDNFPTRYLVNDACELLGLPLVWGSILGFEGQASVFWSGRGPTYRDVFPTPPPPGSVPSCADGGVFGAMCGVIGSTMATEAIKLICGTGGGLLGRILVYDALTASFRTVAVRPDPTRPKVTELIDYPAFCGLRPAGSSSIGPTELAGLLAGADPVLLIDVREPAEFLVGALPGSVNIPLDQITSATSLDLIEGADRVVLYCRSGARSAQAVGRLAEAGAGSPVDLDGGYLGWIGRPGAPVHHQDGTAG